MNRTCHLCGEPVGPIFVLYTYNTPVGPRSYKHHAETYHKECWNRREDERRAQGLQTWHLS